MATFVWTAENNGTEPLDVSIMFTFKNGRGVKDDGNGGCHNHRFEEASEGRRVSGVSINHNIQDMKCTYCVGGAHKVSGSPVTMPTRPSQVTVTTSNHSNHSNHKRSSHTKYKYLHTLIDHYNIWSLLIASTQYTTQYNDFRNFKKITDPYNILCTDTMYKIFNFCTYKVQAFNIVPLNHELCFDLFSKVQEHSYSHLFTSNTIFSSFCAYTIRPHHKL